MLFWCMKTTQRRLGQINLDELRENNYRAALSIVLRGCLIGCIAFPLSARFFYFDNKHG